LVLVALTAMVLLGMAALALDGGNLYLQRRQMQTAADAAALAAARGRCLNEDNWQDVGNAYCLANGADNTDPNPCNVVAGSSARSAQATATKRVQTWFAGLLGSEYGTIDVSARAEASCGNVGAAKNLLPLAVSIPLEGFEPGDGYELFDKESKEYTDLCCTADRPSQCDDMSGAFGWVDWDSQKWKDEYPDRDVESCNLKDSINDLGCAPLIQIGDLLFAEPGVSNAAQKETARWCNQHVTVPVYVERDPPICSGGTGNPGANTNYRVIGFAEFLLTSICTSKNEDDRCGNRGQGWCGESKFRIEGEFIGWLDPDSIGDPSAPDIGVYMVHLAE
jgi:hypothetical protein